MCNTENVLALSDLGTERDGLLLWGFDFLGGLEGHSSIACSSGNTQSASSVRFNANPAFPTLPSAAFSDTWIVYAHRMDTEMNTDHFEVS